MNIKKIKTIVFIFIIIFLLNFTLSAKTIPNNFVSTKYKCSFNVSSANWKGSDSITLSIIKSGLVEYINIKNFSSLIFSVSKIPGKPKENKRQERLFDLERIRKAKETFISILKSRTDRVWPIRGSYYSVNGIDGYKQEIGFSTHSLYNGIIVVFVHKHIEYIFFYSCLEKNYRSSYEDFLKIISTFKVLK